jgi:phosphoserine phosphatase
MAVVSGGFLPLAQFVKNELNLDYAFANEVRSQLDQ